MILAGIDIGTLTCRLLIAEVHPAQPLIEKYAERRILRLGEGVDRSRLLTESAMERVVETLSEWRSRVVEHQVDAIIVVATSAVREAENREEFLAKVKTYAGFDVEVLNGEEEARRTLLGIRSGLPSNVSALLGVDIGGGSTELMLEREKEIQMMWSMDIGVVRLTERVLRCDPPTMQEVNAAESLILDELKKMQERLGDLKSVTLVGTAGTVTTLAAMAQQLSRYDPARIHNFSLPLSTIRDLEDKLRRRSCHQRTQLLGLEKGREEVILAGTVILRCVMEQLGFDQCVVSDYGLREGILVERASRGL